MANRGVLQNFSFIKNASEEKNMHHIFRPETTDLITLVLSDKLSRRLEFSRDSILNLQQKVAVKTGTSTDYKDSWAIGYNKDYVVGVWLGNLNYQSMNGASGAIGAGIILRNIFDELYKFHNPSEIGQLSDKIVKKNIDGYEEYFARNNNFEVKKLFLSENRRRIMQPTNNLEILLNPKIPSQHQKLQLIAENLASDDRVSWFFDGLEIENDFVQLDYGYHSLLLKVADKDGNMFFDKVDFACK